MTNPYQPFSTFDPTKPKKPINQFSAKRYRRLSERQATVAATKKRAGNQCEAADQIPEVKRCQLPLDTHEILSRGRGGSPYDPANTMLACRACHTWLTEHPLEAEDRGLLLPSQPTKGLLYDRRRDG